MKKILGHPLLLLILALLTACAGPQRHVQAIVADVNFEQFESFYIESVQREPTYLRINEMIDVAITEVLQSKGYRLADSSALADLRVRYMTRFTHENVLKTEAIPDSTGNFYMKYQMVPVHEGALLLNILASKTQQLIWNGSTIRDISRVDMEGVTQEGVTGAVEELLESLPARAFSF